MVRLKVCFCFLFWCFTALFQFQNGAIKSWKITTSSCASNLFLLIVIIIIILSSSSTGLVCRKMLPVICSVIFYSPWMRAVMETEKDHLTSHLTPHCIHYHITLLHRIPWLHFFLLPFTLLRVLSLHFQVPVGLMSGYLVARYLPEHGHQDGRTLWLIIALLTMYVCVCVCVCACLAE